MNKKQNIFHRLGDLFSKVAQKSITFNTLPTGGFNGSIEDIFDTYNLKTFKESLYLFIGVSMIRETVSSIPLQMYQIKNKEGEVDEIYDDPFLDLLERPNEDQTYKEFMKLSVAYYLLAGEAFWYLERGDDLTAVPTAMINMRPDSVTILFGEDKKTLIGYEFNQGDGTTIKLRKEDVLHIKNIDPTNPIRGIGVIRPATPRIITEKEASAYQSNTFKKQGRPDVAVIGDDPYTQEQIDDMQEAWQKKFGKMEGSKLAIFGGIKTMQQLGTTPKEMEFMTTMNFLRDDILASLHIPKPMVTSDDVNLANSKTARINYIKEACLPVLDAFHDVINNKFLNDMDQDRFVTYENPVNEDREMLLKEATELKDKGIITIDEARSLMSYDAIEGGDILAPGMGVPLQLSLRKRAIRKFARSVLRKRPILMKKFKAIEEVTKLVEAEKSVKRSRNSVFNTAELRDKYVKAFNKNVDKKAKGFKDTITVYNDGFVKRIVKYMTDFGINSTTFFDVSAEIIEAKAIFEPMMLNMYSKVGEETMQNVANGFATDKASEAFFTSEEAKKRLADRAQFFIQSMLNTDYEDLKEVIVQGMTDGAGVEEIGRKLREYFDDMSVSRSNTIARTETGRLVSEATQDAYSQSAIITGKEWITAGDGKVREEHQINNGIIVDTNGVFPNGESYPGQSSINCRCVIAPAI